MDDFTDAQIAYMNLLVRYMHSEQQHKDDMRALIEKNDLDQKLVPSVNENLKYEFVDVSLEHVESYTERKFLQSLPTSFSLQKGEVDRLRTAAGDLLDNDENFQALLDEFK